MKKTDMPKWGSVPYKEVCSSCKKEYTVYTQKDDYPEYHTDIFVQCECGDVVLFSLPVN